MPFSVAYGNYGEDTQSLSMNNRRNALRRLSQPLPGPGVGAAQSGAAIRFAYSNGVIASLYAGAMFQDATIVTVSAAVLASMKNRCSNGRCLHETTVFQLCGTERDAAHTFGLVISPAGHLRQVKTATAAWAQARCFIPSGYQFVQGQQNIETWQTPDDPEAHLEMRTLRRSDKCKTEKVMAGDGCDTLAARCSISADDFMRFNTISNLCATLMPDQLVCCSDGTLPAVGIGPADAPTAPSEAENQKIPGSGHNAGSDHSDDSSDSCKSVTVRPGDGCDTLAARCEISAEDFMKCNTAPDLCSSLMPGQLVCCPRGPPQDKDPELTVTLDTPNEMASEFASKFAQVGSPTAKSAGDTDGENGEDDDEKDDKDDKDKKEEEDDRNDKGNKKENENKTQAGNDSDAEALSPMFDKSSARETRSEFQCAFFKPLDMRRSREMCKEPCNKVLDKVLDDEISNYGCVGNYPLDEDIPYVYEDDEWSVPALCVCNSKAVNLFFEKFIDAMEAIAQIGCFILTQSLNFMLDIATTLIPGGAPLKLGLQGLVNAASYASYTYESDNDPAGAFMSLFNACGDSDLVPDDLKKGFAIAGALAGGGRSFKKVPINKPPKPKWKRGSGTKGDKGNPDDEGSDKSNDKSGGKPSQTKIDAAQKTGSCTLPDNPWLYGV